MKVFSAVVAAAVIAAPMMFSSAASADEATFKAKCAGCHGPTVWAPLVHVWLANRSSTLLISSN